MTLITYNVQFYVNGELTSNVENLNFDQAYKTAVPGEALTMDGWHVLMKHAAREQISKLLQGETLRISWQDPPRPGFDCEHILMMVAPRNTNKVADWSTIQPATHNLSNFFQSLQSR